MAGARVNVGVRKRGMDWAVEAESEYGSCAAFGVSGMVFRPVAQDEGRAAVQGREETPMVAKPRGLL